jgi:hypothetical protein
MDAESRIRTRQILNLRAADYLNEREKIYAKKLMGNGFLDSNTDEYGYYHINLKWNVDSDDGFLIILSAVTLGILQTIGIPYEIDTYRLTASLEIFDSNGNLISDFKRSGGFRQAVGYYYGRDNSKKAGKEFAKLFEEIQESINTQSEIINRKLLEAGPVGDKNMETASRNMLVYLATNYGRVSMPKNTVSPVISLNTAINNSHAALSRNIAENSIVAIVNISAEDNAEETLVINELTTVFVNSKKYIIVERNNLEEIKNEHEFQMTGEVDDASVVSIGHFLGADVVITGTIIGESGKRRLMLRALDVKTAQILAASSERI